MFIYVCMNVCMYACMHTCMHVCVFVYSVYIHVYVIDTLPYNADTILLVHKASNMEYISVLVSHHVILPT